MKIKPLHDRIVVEAAAREEISAGGIILPDSAQEKPLRGTVVAAGPGKTLDSGKIAVMEVKVGDTVLYGKYAGTEVTVEGTDYVILRQDDVLALVSGIPTRAAVTPKQTTKAAPAPAAKKPVAAIKKPAAKKPAGARR